MGVSGFLLMKYEVESENQKEHFEQLAVIADILPEQEEIPTDKKAITDKETVETGKNISGLQALNSDCIGWIEISGTSIDFPVMQSPDEPELYLKSDFNKNYSRYGVPFLDYRCDLTESDNLIIYGHHMTDGSMFSDLHKYMDKDFCAENPIITIYTTEGIAEYEIFAVLPETGTVPQDGQSIFKLINCTDETEFGTYMEYLKDRSLYDTDITAEYGDKLITLTTCEYSQNNGRLAVVGRKV